MSDHIESKEAVIFTKTVPDIVTDFFSFHSAENLETFEIKGINPVPSFFLVPLFQGLALVLARCEGASFVTFEPFISTQLKALGLQEANGRFQIGQTFGVPTDYQMQNFFELMQLQMNLWWGISKHRDFSPVPILPAHGIELNLRKELHEIWDLVNNRKSAMRFPLESRLCKTDIDEILKVSFFRLKNRNLPYGSAGGFSYLKALFVTMGIGAESEGVYSIDQDSGLWAQVNCTLNVRELKRICFDQESYLDCKNFLILALDIEEPSRKYGSRAMHFGTLAAGGVLDRMHLASTQLQIPFRALGGFDEILLLHAIGNRKVKHISVVIAIG